MTSEKGKSTGSIENLLMLNGEIFPMENGYWTKFEVWIVPPVAHIPHGIRYSLSMHDRNNTRILGFDNAHAVKPARKRFGGVKITWDHTHKRNKVEVYEFETADQLLEDFWEEVDRILYEGAR